MNPWRDLRNSYSAWLRQFPLLACIGTPGDSPEIIGPSSVPIFADAQFWSSRTHSIEARACRHLTESEIDAIFEEVAAVIDEDLLRFNPLVEYYGQFAANGDVTRIEWEREAAHSVKRDLAWAAIEQVVCEPGFFCELLPWYERGRWPCGWEGTYPAGILRVL